ncbi:hypothetical protein O1V66_04980 [Rouxiella chamberiensis]|uniref:Major facilitator superfamily (MFS) profile domain-containing protein n=1 Tax=Rouxiella chamberiensis TaxID=1513468 RepID=A0ABY7HT95_9GAMM|nr:MFS transporter [Rouxiella chamberiensis]WAT02041.1 hypothetical protein O1V66_04980 [Rouxiella chamberiensis]
MYSAKKSLNDTMGNRRWSVAFILLVGGFINYLDRASLSVAAPTMMEDLHLSNTDIGLMGSVFSLFLLLVSFLPVGWPTVSARVRFMPEPRRCGGFQPC